MIRAIREHTKSSGDLEILWARGNPAFCAVVVGIVLNLLYLEVVRWRWDTIRLYNI